MFGKKDYYVKLDNEDLVTPEETLLDANSSHSDLETPISSGIFNVAYFLVLAGIFVLLFVIFKMSIVNHDAFAATSLRNRSFDFSVAPPRGIIMDHNGKPLVSNIPSFDLLLVSRELPKDHQQRLNVLAQIAAALGQSDDFIKNTDDQLKTNSVYFALSDMTKDQVLALKSSNIKGVYVTTSAKRNYIDGQQFSTIIGYVGRVNKTDLEQDGYYLPSDIIGRLGIESSYEKYLRGEHGKLTFSRKDEETNEQNPIAGDNLVLNIDFDLQKKLYNSLYGVMRSANLSSGAAVIQNPQTGAVLAMVSLPSFDNNLFNSQISTSDYKQLFESKLRPLFNRVVGGLYNPGSTIKPFIGMTGLQEHVITGSDTIQDCVNITIANPFNPSDPYVFKNWRPDYGLFNLRRAIAQSCNVFFFSVGGGFGKIVGLGVDKIYQYLTKALATTNLGIDLPGEQHGFVPTPEWKQKTRGEPWYQGDTFNISIGQGDLIVTPLWLNTYVSAIANGGTLYRPQVAQSIVDADKKPIKQFDPEVIGQLPFKPEVIAEVKDDMRETVLTGTAHLLSDVPVSVGAKTGTAEVIKGHSINALFTAFAPAEKPELSITVLVEGSASNEGYAIRTANEVLKWYFGDRASKSN